MYVLLLRTGRYYVGSTNDVERRLVQHQMGRVISTKGQLPVRLLYVREYATLTEARQMEVHIKRMKSRKYVEEFMDS